MKRLPAIAALIVFATTPDLTVALEDFPKFAPYEIKNLEERPHFWRVRPAEIVELCRNVKRGRSEIIATTPGGRSVYAVFYGDFPEAAPQTNWSAGSSSTTWKTYVGDKPDVQTIMFCAGIHGAEAESVAAAVNLIRLMETGKDFRGKTDEELLTLVRKYRLIVIPCENMDGRAISPDHLRGVDYQTFRAVSQGTWKDGSLIGWRGSKEYFPLPLDRVSYPGGYPNAAGVNIMHDAAPGDVRSEEARGLLKLVARWRVDLLLNGHSCEYAPSMLSPSIVNYPANVERGLQLVQKVNEAFLAAGLRTVPANPPKPTSTLNLNNLATMSSGALALTLECSVSYERPKDPKVTYTFEQLMEPNFIMLKVMMKEGLEKPFIDRSKAGQVKVVDSYP
ncbi:MAG TPA: M14 family zinc carboxypeptidase [Verrucomicrobiae bacterium]|nr:M14 family zinc carboxypeptidase [Verrucomicrobiae bacterium]